MRLKCPACASAIQRRENGDLPTPGTIYRCPVCRLELVFDPNVKKMRPLPPCPSDKSSSNVG